MAKTRRVRLDSNLRALICLKYDQGDLKKEIADDLRLKYTTVSSVIDVYTETGRIEKNTKNAGRKSKLTTKDKEKILEYIKEDCSIGLEEIRRRLEVERAVYVSTTTIGRVLDDFHYSFKRVQYVPVRRNARDNVIIRYNYAREFTKFGKRPVIFLDEMGVQLTMRRRYGRAPVGVTPRKTVVSIRSKNVSVSAAMTRNKLYYFDTSLKPYRAETYVPFLERLLAKLAADHIRKAVLIVDNCKFHAKPEVRTKIEEGGHTLWFVPPYTPHLNPIEEIFSKWKALMRAKNCKNQEDLFASLQSCSLLITSANCRSYYKHMEQFLEKALRKEDF